MKIDKYRQLLKNNGIIIIGIVIVIFIGGYYFFKDNNATSLRLVNDTFFIEYGQTISMEVKEYLKLTNSKEKEDIIKKANMVVDAIGQKEYPDIGKYSAKITYKEEVVDFTIVVQDTTPPIILPIEDSTVPLGTILDQKQCKEKVRVEDLQATTIEIVNREYNGNKEGKYQIEVIVKDASNNVTTTAYYVQVKKETELSKQHDKAISSDNKEEKAIDKPTSSTEEQWWGSLSNQEIKTKVIPSLVWKNEWTNTMYYGIEGLTYGFNVEDKAYGGLQLVENPYNIQFDFGFYGGLYCQTNTNSFSLYWQAPIGPGREVDCGKIAVSIPTAITGQELYDYYNN